MQHFVDSNNVFAFPEFLFPESGNLSPSTRMIYTSLPTVSHRRAQILSQSPSQAHIDEILSQPRPNLIKDVTAWTKAVLEFHEVWSPMPEDTIRLALKLLMAMVRAGNHVAAYILGSWGGLKMSPHSPDELVSTSDRRTYLRQALKNGVNGAWYRVAMNANERNDVEQAYSRFQRGADKNDPACLYTIGLAHLQGHFGLTKDVKRGLYLVELSLRGASSEFPRAPYLLGKIWIGEGGTGPNGLGIAGLEGHVPEGKMGAGLELIAQSARLGFAPALLRMADAYLGSNSDGTSGAGSSSGERGFDAGVALRYLSLAADQDTYRRYRILAPILGGKPESQIVKWLLCGYSDVVVKSEVWAFRFAEVGALDQNGSALFALAYFSEVGIATTQNSERAAALYQLSADRGFQPALARLNQLRSGPPALRRSLTRKDHEAKMHKHSAALMRGTLNASDAINDESTMQPDPQVSLQEEPELTAVKSSRVSPQAEPSTMPSTVQQPQPIPQKRATVLPYPTSSPGTSPGTSPQHSPQRGRHSPSRSFAINGTSAMSSRSSLHRSIRSVSALPYPVDKDEFAHLGPFISPHISPQNSPRGSPISSTASLPYPDSPEKRHTSTFSHNYPAMGSRSASSSNTSLNVPRKPVLTPSQAPPQPPILPSTDSIPPPQPPAPGPHPSHLAQVSQPGHCSQQGQYSQPGPQPSQQPGQFSQSGQFSQPSQVPDRPPQSDEQAPPDSFQEKFHTPPPPSGTAFTGPVLQKKSTSQPAQSRNNPSPSAPPEQIRHVSTNTSIEARQGPPITKPGAMNFATAAAAAPPTNGIGQVELGPPRGSAPPVTGRLMSSNPSSANTSSVTQSMPASRASSTSPESSSTDPNVRRSTSPIPRTKSPRRRPLSTQWMSSVGSRIFSTGNSGSHSATSSSSSIDMGPHNLNQSPDLSAPSVKTTKSAGSAGSAPAPSHRSASPLRKMFGSTPEQRAAAARADRRSFTEAALAELASVPKVPVKPINTERVPGVAYTFEEMGIKTVSSEKSEKCTIM